MSDWIEDGESGASVRAKLNSLNIPLVSVDIATPAHEIIIPLAAGYWKYELDALFTVDAADSIYFQVSTDGGSTYHSGDEDYFSIAEIGPSTSGNFTTGGGAYLNPDPLFVGNAAMDIARPCNFKATIYPGGDGINASFWNSAASFTNVTHAPVLEWWYTSLEVSASRITHLKILAPNVGADNITGGYYSLKGEIKTA